jgi:conjugative relaxase-like TrwC/TraI family protein
MTMHKLTAGDGYTYLTRHIAGGDVDRTRGQAAADYYTAKGNPPGVWVGRGAPLLDVSGQQVTEGQMRNLFGSGMHPDADRIISEYLDEHLRGNMTDRQLAKVRTDALRAATQGTAFPAYEALERFDSRVTARLEQIREVTGRQPTETEIKKIHAEESRRARAAVAGFDVVFAPVKSAALLWALDERGDVRSAVREAHEAARDSALEILETHAAYTRTGRGGIAQIETKGLIAAQFDHYDSRAGDPNLHTHIAISSKVQGVDGIWRSLDARVLYKMTVAVSEFYNTRFETELTTRLGVSWTERPDTAGKREPVREIAGIDPKFVEHFSSRRTQIEARYEQLLRQFRRDHGYDPSRAVCHDLARQANLETRDAKKAPRSLAEMREDWTTSLVDTYGKKSVRELMAAVPEHRAPSVAQKAEPVDVDALAATVVAKVSEGRSTWTVWNIRAEAERAARIEHGVSTREEHQELVSAVVSAAVSPAHSIRVDAPRLLNEPASLRRADKESVFTEHAAARFTSAAILAAEVRLVEAAKTHTAFGASGPYVAAVLDGFEARSGIRLDLGQRQMATVFAVDDRLVVAGIGPGGSGKTTAMRAYAETVAATRKRLIPLATSSAAANILGRELGTRAENLHKFLHEYSPAATASQALWNGTSIPSWAESLALRPGDVILVDEAGMAGTFNLDRLIEIATHRGAVVRLLGDYRQLGAVESGGALRLIANEAGAVELSSLYRFNDPREADATLKLRVGDTSGLDFYAEAGRIRSGSAQGMIEAAYAGWKADMLAGKKTIMAAATGADVAALSAQARLDRIEAGDVEAEGARLHDGNLAGFGDWIVTRKNDRKNYVSGSRDWVKNGDAWTITKRYRDGSLTAKHMDHRGTVRLSAAYVAANVELLYATTTNRAQGSTVDTAHPLVTAEMSRENLYVILSRARERTMLYVETHELLPFDEDDRLDRVKNDARQFAAREILTAILSRESNETSATEAIAASQQAAGSLATIAPPFQHALEIAVRPVYKQLVYKTFTTDDGTERGDTTIPDAIAAGPGYAKLRRTLLAADQAGHSPATLLARAANEIGITDADSLPDQPATDLARRINTLLDLCHTSIPHSERRPSTIPAWYSIPDAAADSAQADIPPYLRQAQDVIASRVDQLADVALADRPSWLTALGPVPDDELSAADWRRHVGAVAAYRDQHQISTDDPRQLLGSHSDADDAAGTPYRHALQAVLAARDINHLDDHIDPRETYRSLAEDERHSVDAAIAESLGVLWFGIGGAACDEAALHPAHAEQLRLALLAHGHLTCPEPNRADAETGRPTPQPVEISLTERRRATREAERASRRERLLSGQRPERATSRQQRRGQTLRPQEVERQIAPPLMEPPTQQARQQERQIEM